jgi:hypothetical protein
MLQQWFRENPNFDSPDCKPLLTARSGLTEFRELLAKARFTR